MVDWMVSRCHGIHNSEKVLHVIKQICNLLGVVKLCEKRRSFSKQAHAYLLYVVTLLSN